MQRSAVSPGSSPFVRLATTFGERLSVERGVDSVRWTCEGRCAVASLRPDGSVEASFVDRPSLDAASRTLAAAVYARPSASYRLDAIGCAHMVDDIVAFFSGTREPYFAFVAIEEPLHSL